MRPASVRIPLADSSFALSSSARMLAVSTIMISAPGATITEGSVTVSTLSFALWVFASDTARCSALVLSSEPSTAQTIWVYMASLLLRLMPPLLQQSRGLGFDPDHARHCPMRMDRLRHRQMNTLGRNATMTQDAPGSAVSLERARRFSVAPMIDWTDRHCRTLHRLLPRNALLFTEMITTGAIAHGDADRHLAFGAYYSLAALQIVGLDPVDLAAAIRIAEPFGYAEYNLNVGCPSDRVQSGKFGACLMAEPELVAECVRAMRDATDRPVTVKCRIGIDVQDTEESLDRFADSV